MTIETFIKASYSSRSIKRIMYVIKEFKAQMGDKADSASYSDIVDHIGYLRSRKLHPKSLTNHLQGIKVYFRYLVAIGKRSDHPCETLYLKDQINRAIHVEDLYTKEELNELYNTFESAPDKRSWAVKSEVAKARDKIILGLLIYQGLTTKEIIQLKLSDIDMQECTVRIREEKLPGRRSNKGRILALKSKQILLIHDYLKVHRKVLWKIPKPSKRTDYFILNEHGLQLWNSYLNRMLREATDDKYKPLKIRQSVIAHLLKENHDIRVVQEFAGHRNAGSTEAYQRTGLEELKTNIERLHPRQ